MKPRMSRAARVSLVCGILFAFLAETLAVASVVRHAVEAAARSPVTWQRPIVLFATFPGLVKASIHQFRENLSADPLPLLVDVLVDSARKRTEKKPTEPDSGYLLFSGVKKSARQSVVELIRLSDDKVLWQWRPNFDEMNRRSNRSRYVVDETRIRSKALAPLLLEDGSIIFNTESRLARLSLCGILEWVLAGPYHHSVEQDPDGSIWVPAVDEHSFPNGDWLSKHLRDDALGHVRTDGRVISISSFSKILIRNGLRALLFGRELRGSEQDPIHLNDIQPATSDGEYWRKGDLLISARGMSTVFLYRPSTGKVLWHKTGPWVSQHDVNFVDSRRISVFGNDVLWGPPTGPISLNESGSNTVYVYDFANDSISTPYAKELAENHVQTSAQGRAKLGGDGALYVEETESGRLLRFRNGQLMWSRVNWYDAGRVGMVNWSRYLTAREVEGFLKLVAVTKCQTTEASK